MSRRFHGAGLVLTAAGLSAAGPVSAAVVAETHRLEEAPYYVDVARRPPSPGSCAVVFPVTIDPEFVHTFGYGGRAGELEPLLAALEERIGSRQGCVRGVQEAPVAAGAPRVYVGSAESEYAPLDVGEQRLPGERFAPMVLHLSRPGIEWRREVGEIVARSGVDYAVVIQLGVSQYMKGYSGVFRKQVALGTDYSQPVKFLTAEDKPVEVLHLAGVLVDSRGRVVRTGAEGIVLRDTPFAAQVLDVERVFDDEELQQVLTRERRHDLPGAPLKIDVALDNLISQLIRGGRQ
jgi:hypothetical protein